MVYELGCEEQGDIHMGWRVGGVEGGWGLGAGETLCAGCWVPLLVRLC